MNTAFLPLFSYTVFRTSRFGNYLDLNFYFRVNGGTEIKNSWRYLVLFLTVLNDIFHTCVDKHIYPSSVD